MEKVSLTFRGMQLFTFFAESLMGVHIKCDLTISIWSAGA